MRVLWLIKGLGPGGAESLLVSAARVLDRDRFDPEVAYLLPWKDALVPALRELDVPVRCFGVRRELDLRWAARLRRTILDDGIDVVHAHSPYAAGVARLVARTIPRRRRPAVVSTEHNQWSSYAIATRALTRATYRLGAAWFTVSTQSRDSLPMSLRRRVEVLVHGIDVDGIRSHRAEREQVRDELGIADGEVLVLTIANLRPQKGYPVLLEAAKDVVARRPNVRFVAVGQGPDLDDMRERAVQLGLDEHAFRFLGFRADAARLLAGADVFTMASHYEGYPVALMEALAMGLPIVATAVSGIADAVTDGVEGRLVPPGDAEGLAAAIVELHDDPERRAAMAAGAAIAGRAFDMSTAVRRMEEVYASVVPRQRYRVPSPR